MNRKLFLSLSACSLILLASCSKKVNLTASNFSVDPNPLEAQGGQVSATVSGMFPEKYVKRNQTITLTPELRTTDGSVLRGEAATFQGEKVMGNNQTINYRLGGRFTMKSNFPYSDTYRKSDLVMVVNERKGKKVNAYDVKIGNGIIATSELYRKTLMADGAVIAPDSFQRVQRQKQEANIRFLVNQANLRQSELKNNSVQEFISLLQRINADREQLYLQNVEISAYASPEGGFAFNDKLANKRQNNTEQYVQQKLKQSKLAGANVNAHYTAQDWEGFQQLVQASNIQDKDVILRVLSMYKDPAEREQQIRNMSEGFQELATGILPELRRSRLTVNYEVIGRSDDEIKQQLSTDATKLSPDELLYAATLDSNLIAKEAIYQKAAQYYDKDYRPLNNLGVMEFDKGNYDQAKTYLQKAIAANKNAGEAYANLGILALKDGDISEAEKYIGRAADANGYNEAAGALNIAKGNYAEAARNLKDETSYTAALAQILSKDYANAAKTLDAIKNPTGLESYLHAIISARRGNKYATESYLEEAIERDPSLKDIADNDLEFQFLRK